MFLALFVRKLAIEWTSNALVEIKQNNLQNSDQMWRDEENVDTVVQNLQCWKTQFSLHLFWFTVVENLKCCHNFH
jgi:hypothetical protein